MTMLVKNTAARTSTRERRSTTAPLPESAVIHRQPGANSRERDGQAFLTENFVREAYADSVEIVALTPAALFLFQDVYVLKPLGD